MFNNIEYTKIFHIAIIPSSNKVLSIPASIIHHAMTQISYIHSQIKIRPCWYKFWSEPSETRYFILLRSRLPIAINSWTSGGINRCCSSSKNPPHNGRSHAKCACKNLYLGGKIRGKLSLNYEPLKRLRVSRFHPPVTWRFPLLFPLFFSCSRTGHAFQFAGGKRRNEFPPRKRMAPR